MKLYRDDIMELWEHPMNYGIVKGHNLFQTEVNHHCGDKIVLTGLVKDRVLVEIKYRGDLCAISKAAASLWTERIKGWWIMDIREATPEQFVREIGMEDTRPQCTLLVFNTLQKALRQFIIKSNQSL